MKKEGGKKGGLPTRRNANTAGSAQQVNSRAQKGIRLLPSRAFRFRPDERTSLIHTLGLPTSKADLLLDRVEERIARYLTELLRVEKASPPSELRQRVVRLRKQAERLSNDLEKLVDLSRPYDHDSQHIGLVVEATWRTARPGEPPVLGTALNQCRRLVDALDLTLDDSVEAIEDDIRAATSGSAWGMNVLAIFRERLVARSRHKLIPKPGRPKRTEDIEMIADIAIAYEDISGKKASSRTGSKFSEFISAVYGIALSGSEAEDTEHRRLIREALKEITR